MSNVHEFDFCVLGAGSAGFAAATTVRNLGKSAAFVEGNEPLAGLCILRGCMPSKTLLRSAEIAHLVKTAPQLGIERGAISVDMREVIGRKRRIIGGFADDRIEGIEQFPLFRGKANFSGRHEINVDGSVVRARAFLISTGSIINVPDIPGLHAAGYLTSDELLELERLPASIIILGGGAVGCEMSQYLARLGAKTTLLQRSQTLLSAEDPDVGETLKSCFEKDGMQVLTGVTIREVAKTGTGKRVTFEVGGKQRSLEAEEIFAALGRRPNVDGFGFDSAGVDFDVRGVKTNEHLQTSNPDIYAAGDVTGFRELVHVAVYDGQMAAHNAFSKHKRKANHDLQAARAIFTDPQVGIAGLTERDCERRGIAYAKASHPFNELGKAISANLTDGFVKILAAPDGRILGVTIVGAEASDLIHEAIALIYFGATVHDVMEMPHLHPTLAEIITYPAEELSERLEQETHALVTP